MRYNSDLGVRRYDTTPSVWDDRRFNPGYEYNYELLNAPPTYQVQLNRGNKKIGMVKGTYINGQQEGYVSDFVNQLNEQRKSPIDLLEGLFQKLIYPTPGEFSTIDLGSYALQSIFIDPERKHDSRNPNPLFNELLAITIELIGLTVVDILGDRGITGDPQSTVRKGFERGRDKKTPVGAFEMIFDDIAREFSVKAKKEYPKLIDEAQGVMLDKLGYKLGKDATDLYHDLEVKGFSKEQIAERFADLEFVSTFVNDRLKQAGISIQVLHAAEHTKAAGSDDASLKDMRYSQKQRDQQQNAARNPSRN